MPAAVFTPGAVEIFVGVRIHNGNNAPPSNPPAPTPEEYPYPTVPPPYEFDPPSQITTPPYPTGPNYPQYSPYPPNSNTPSTFTPTAGSGLKSTGVKATYSSDGSEQAAAENAESCDFLNARWYYLGSAVVAPEVTASVVHTPYFTDHNKPDPFQVIFNSEWHQVAGTLNRVNWRTYNKLRDSFFAAGNDIRKSFETGKLVLHSEDVLLFIRYALPHVGAGFAPDAQSRGRVYYSAILVDYHESAANGRVQEITLLFDCHPLYCTHDRRFHLYTEADEDLPTLTPE